MATMETGAPALQVKAWVESRVEYITPEIARRYLMRRYDGQRKLRKHRVDLYAADMTAGRWSLTHQGIAFDTQGRLVDGQHRLAAVVQAGVGVDMLVTRGIEGDTFVGMDRGMIRGAHDNAPEAWMADRVAIAVARGALMGYEVLNSSGQRRPTDWQVFEFMEQHRAALEFVRGLFAKNIARVGQAMVQAAFVRAYYYFGAAHLESCAAALKSGILPDEHYSGVGCLRTFLTSPSMRRGGGKEVQFEVYAKSERALYATLHGEVLGRLRSANGELFPFPS